MASDLVWRFPIRRPHAGVPMANGAVGVLVWGAERSLRLTIARNGFWDRRGAGTALSSIDYQSLGALLRARDQAGIDRAFGRGDGMWGAGTPHQVGGGRLVIDLPAGWALVTARLRHGVLRITGRRGRMNALATAWVDPDTGAIRVDLPPAWRRAEVRLVASGTLAPQDWATHGYAPPVITADGFRQDLPADPPLHMALRRDGARVVVTTSIGAVPRSEMPRPAAATAWWRAAAQDLPRVVLPDRDLQDAYDRAVVRLLACTAPGGPACTLQGPLMEDDRIPPWCNDYHANINLQMIYGALLPLNRPAHGAPLWRLVGDWAPDLARTGAAFFRDPEAWILPHACDDRGRAVGSLWTGTIDHGATAWMALLAWDWYRATGDRRFLRTLAWPFLRGAWAGYRAMLRDDGPGGLHLPVSVSPEFRGAALDAWGEDASFQLAACHAVLRALGAAAAVLGEAPDPAWAEAQRRLPPWTLIQGQRWQEWPGTPAERIAVWAGQDLPFSHRHHSHLAGIFPFATLDPGLHWWTLLGTGAWAGWSVPWAAAIWARAGQADAWLHCLRHWRSAFINEGGGTLHDAAFAGGSALAHDAPHRQPMDAAHGEIFQLDASGGLITAVAELIAQERGGVLHLLPAGLPRDWRDLAVDHLGRGDGLRVDVHVRDGRVTTARVRATRTVQVRVRWEERAFSRRLRTGETLDLLRLHRSATT
jgi:alpha-L-fucosidase 2